MNTLVAVGTGNNSMTNKTASHKEIISSINAHDEFNWRQMMVYTLLLTVLCLRG